jgi:hypothetical protein
MKMRWILFLLFSALLASAQTGILYSNNFEKAEVGKLPEDMMALQGEFRVKAERGNKMLELPGAPLETFAVLFGPTETDNVAVSARIVGTAKGRRAPAFGVGLNGVSGYKLQLSAAKGALELLKDQETKAGADYNWKSGQWTWFRLEARNVKKGEWRIQGRAWAQGEAEPDKWLVTFEEKEEPVPGRASVIGIPYSGAPIQYDDLTVYSIR